MTSPTPNRNPLAEQLRKVAPAIAALVAIVNGLGSAGVLSAAQTSAISSYGDQVAAAAAPTSPISLAVGSAIGLVTGGLTLLGILKAGKGAEAQTTPVTSPRDSVGAVLVRADGLPLGSPAGVVVGDVPVGEPFAADPATESIRP